MVRLGSETDKDISDLDLYEEAQKKVPDELIEQGVKVAKPKLPLRHEELNYKQYRVKDYPVHLTYV